MSEAPSSFSGDRLTLDEYLDDYYARFWRTDRNGCWKLERQQTFRELDNASWEASARGDWEQALTLLEEGRDRVREYQEKVLAHGFEFRRLRVVERPYSSYLIWELNSLLIRHEYGERIRVVTSDVVQGFEHDHPLPEIVVLGTEVAYQALYNDTGLAEAAIRSTDPETVRLWIDFIGDLYEGGENLTDFFAREIADLRPTGSA
jgi:hypothetical protein